jgi:hypothetical protein
MGKESLLHEMPIVVHVFRDYFIFSFPYSDSAGAGSFTQSLPDIAGPLHGNNVGAVR